MAKSTSVKLFILMIIFELMLIAGIIGYATATGRLNIKRLTQILISHPTPTLPQIQVQPLDRPVMHPIRIAIFGDIRPACRSGSYDTVRLIPVLQGIAHSAPDLIVGTGDYVCAWPHQPERTLRQLQTLGTLFEKNLLPYKQDRIWLAGGNHEVGHADAIRATLGSDPFWVAESNGVQVIGLPSDYVMSQDTDAKMAWLARAYMHPVSVRILIRHEPGNLFRSDTGSGYIRNDTRYDHLIQPYLAMTDLVVFGHIHQYKRIAPRAVIVGNGGAEYTTGFFGYVTVDTLPPDTIRITAYETVGPVGGMIKDTWDIKRLDKVN